MTKPIEHAYKHTYQLSYKDYIRKFNKQKIETINTEELKVFTDNVYTLSPIDDIKFTYWYKRHAHDNHKYTLNVFSKFNDEPHQIDCYNELTGSDGWISTAYNEVAPTSDFLTGYYLSACLLSKSGIWFHYGYADDQLARGVRACRKQSIRYGADINTDNIDDDVFGDVNPVADRSLIRNGTTQSGDLANGQVVKSICNQLKEIGEFDLFICDVSPTSCVQLFNALIIALSNVSNNGATVIRLPSVYDWHLYPAVLVSYFILVKLMFNNVQIFKCPWGVIPKYYLILKNKNKVTTRLHSAIIMYIRHTNATVPFLSNTYNISDDNIKEFNKLQYDLKNCYSYMDSSAVNTKWIDKVISII